MLYMLNLFGWCTWDAFYTNLITRGVKEILKRFLQTSHIFANTDSCHIKRFGKASYFKNIQIQVPPPSSAPRCLACSGDGPNAVIYTRFLCLCCKATIPDASSLPYLLQRQTHPSTAHLQDHKLCQRD